CSQPDRCKASCRPGRSTQPDKRRSNRCTCSRDRVHKQCESFACNLSDNITARTSRPFRVQSYERSSCMSSRRMKDDSRLASNLTHHAVQISTSYISVQGLDQRVSCLTVFKLYRYRIKAYLADPRRWRTRLRSGLAPKPLPAAPDRAGPKRLATAI